ncbi:BA14K family protein [Agrobacterium tomkonis]
MRISSGFATGSDSSTEIVDSDPLWSFEVRRVYPGKQSYERLPSIYAPDAEISPANRANLVPLPVATISGSRTGDVPRVSKLQEDWCIKTYRSYDPSDNTYQPFGEGPRRTCVAPLEDHTVSSDLADGGGDAEEYDANARWCMERYSSYRITDNTYQPFTGGRKSCKGPTNAG